MIVDIYLVSPDDGIGTERKLVAHIGDAPINVIYANLIRWYTVSKVESRRLFSTKNTISINYALELEYHNTEPVHTITLQDFISTHAFFCSDAKVDDSVYTEYTTILNSAMSEKEKDSYLRILTTDCITASDYAILKYKSSPNNIRNALLEDLKHVSDLAPDSVHTLLYTAYALRNYIK